MKRVYALTTGDYSDYSVDAVFATEELAAHAVELHDELHGRQFEPDGPIYDLANPVKPLPYFDEPARRALKIVVGFLRWPTPYDANVPLVESAMTGAEQGTGGPPRPPDEDWIGEWELEHSDDCRVYIAHTGGHWFKLKVEGLDAERVRKVFSEKRAELIAQPWIGMSHDAIAAAIGAAKTEDW